MSKDPHAGERAALGSRCRELIDSPAFIEAVAAIDAQYQQQTFRTAFAARDEREEMFREYHAFRRLIQRLNKWETDGVMAQTELESQT